MVYDWDSLAIRTEPTIVGAAATVFASTTGSTIAASVSDTATFLDSYQRRRERFPSEDMRAAWAAGLWTLLYNAKKETAGGGVGYLKHLEAELEERMRLAGLLATRRTRTRLWGGLNIERLAQNAQPERLRKVAGVAPEAPIRTPGL